MRLDHDCARAREAGKTGMGIGAHLLLARWLTGWLSCKMLGAEAGESRPVCASVSSSAGFRWTRAATPTCLKAHKLPRASRPRERSEKVRQTSESEVG